ncbi:MAG: DUF1961 family protein [Flavobacterium sp.]|uniref:DUF1961 family protein n=1 Tax=Flavobacterium sp. TaxID=239 RepID=UPI003BDF9A87
MKNRLQNNLFVLLVIFTGTIYGQEFSKGKLLYSNALSNSEMVKDWILEGPAKVEFKNNWMHIYSPNEEGHHVFWCPKDFPGNFIAEWEAQNQEIDAGLCIVFFSAKGLKGESIFDVSMPKRTLGTFTDYTKGAMNDYHISYYANGRDNPNRETANLRKNKGFHLVQTGEIGIPVQSKAIHKMKLIKHEGKILLFVDERKVIDWTDDGIKYGKILEDGKIGFRQMQWTHFAYRNFEVWENIKSTKINKIK